jgi:hypothetical protein
MRSRTLESFGLIYIRNDFIILRKGKGTMAADEVNGYTHSKNCRVIMDAPPR